MKHTVKHPMPLSIRLFEAAPGKKKLLASSLFFFCIFFCASLGSLLCMQEVFLPVPQIKPYLFYLLCSSCFALLLFLFLKKRGRCFPYSLAYLLLPLLLLCLFHDRLFSSFSDCARYLCEAFGQLYRNQEAASSSKTEGTPFFFHVFVLLILQVFFLHFMLYQKRWLFLLSLCLPAGFGIFFDHSPSFLALGLFLAAFLLWEFFLFPICTASQLPRLIPVVLLLGAYGICAGIFVPRTAPSLFQASPALKEAVNSAGNWIVSRLPKDSGADQGQEPSSLPDPGFSYETGSKKQALTNASPAYSNAVRFSLTSDQPLSAPLYLRGFVGASYSNALWEAPSDSQSLHYAREQGLSSFSSLYSLPYQAMKHSGEEKIRLNLTRRFHSSYTYLPYGAALPSSFSVGEHNQLETPAGELNKCSFYPLSTDQAVFLFAPSLPSRLQKAEKIYKDYACRQYTEYSEQGLEQLKEAVSSFDSYPLSSSASWEEISAAITEVQEYLWSRASYSLSLDSSQDTGNFLYDFLYGRATASILLRLGH